MFIQGLGSLASAYSTPQTPATQRQIIDNASANAAANYADTVTISSAARDKLASAQSAAVDHRLAEIKAKPAMERVDADWAYLKEHDAHHNALLQKIQTSGYESLTADEVDYEQKAGGFVNTMAELSSGERAMYDELVAQGNSTAASGLLLVGMARIGMGGQSVTLPNGKTFDPQNTEVTADNIRNLFSAMFVDSSGQTDRQFDALASWLDRREAANSNMLDRTGNMQKT